MRHSSCAVSRYPARGSGAGTRPPDARTHQIAFNGGTVGGDGFHPAPSPGNPQREKRRVHPPHGNEQRSGHIPRKPHQDAHCCQKEQKKQLNKTFEHGKAVPGKRLSGRFYPILSTLTTLNFYQENIFRTPFRPAWSRAAPPSAGQARAHGHAVPASLRPCPAAK